MPGGSSPPPRAHYLNLKSLGTYDLIAVHGTDTMAYTASALSLMLRGFLKPIVMTGEGGDGAAATAV